MTSEELRVTISAKISDFDRKMSSVDKKIAAIQKGSKAASQVIDKMLAAKNSATHKAVDLVDKKLKQVRQSASITRKALASKMAIGVDSAGLELQKMKLDQLRQKYNSLTSGAQAPASLKAMEKEFMVVTSRIAETDAKLAKLYSDMQSLQSLQGMAKNVGDTNGMMQYQAQIDAVQREMDSLAASTDSMGAKAESLNAKMQNLRMNPSASPEAQLLAARIRQADEKMSSLGSSTSKTTRKISGMRSGSSALDLINRKISSLERTSARTANAVGKLGRRFLVLFTGKLISTAFKGIQDSLTGAATKSDELKSSLDTLTSAGRTISNSVVAALAPLINVAAPMIDYISKKIMDFGNSVAMFFASISGQSTVLQATAAYEAYGAAAEGAGSSAASGAAEARKALAGFDQITKLETGKSGSSGSGGSGSSGPSGATSYVTVPVVQSELAKKVKQAIEDLSGPFTRFYKDVLEPLGKWAMTDGLDFLADGLNAVAKFFKDNPQLIDNLAVFLLTLGGLSALGPVPLAIGITIQASIAGVEWFTGVDVPQAVKNSFDKELWESAGVDFGDFLLDAFIWGFNQTSHYGKESPAAKINEAIMKAFNTNTAGGWMFAYEIGINIGTSLINGIIWAVNQYIKLPFFTINSALQLIGKEPIKVPEIDYVEVTPFYEDWVNGTKEASVIVDRYNKQIGRTNEATAILTKGNRIGADSLGLLGVGAKGATGGFNFLKTGATGAMTGVQTATSTLLLPTMQAGRTSVETNTKGMVSAFSVIPNQISEYMNRFAGGVATGTGQARSSMYWDAFYAVRDTVPVYSRFANLVTHIFENLAENSRLAMLAVVKNISRVPRTLSPVAIASSLSGLYGGALASLPVFAQGGVVNSATAGIIGEAGKEVVMPLERNTGWIDQLADRVSSKMGGGGGDIYLTVQNVMDGRVISEQVTKIQKRDARRSNKPVWGNA